jgi:cob(I)alamin adenosyltransferase
MSIATRKGDAGTTGLLHGQRVPKDHPQVEAVGAFDELNVEIGAARMLSQDPAVGDLLKGVQASLIAVMGEIACAEEDAARHSVSKFARLGDGDLARLDGALAALESKGIRLDGWATPGANPSALAFDRARVAARRAERSLAAVAAGGRNLRPVVAQWTNRLSDVLWLLAREAESAPPRA